MLMVKRGVRMWKVAADALAAIGLVVAVVLLERQRPIWELERAGVEVTISGRGDPVSLSFVGATADEATLARAADFKTVIWIDLSGSQVTTPGLRHLRKLPNLKSLNLSRTAPGSGALVEVGSMRALRKLRLDGCEWLTDTDLRSLRSLDQLQHLSLSQTAIAAAALSELQTLPRLEVLQIDGCVGLEQGTLRMLAEFPRLKSVEVRGVRVSLAQLRDVIGARHAPELLVDQVDVSELEPLLNCGAHISLDEKLDVPGIGLDGEFGIGELSCYPSERADSARARRLVHEVNAAWQRSAAQPGAADDSTLALLLPYPGIGSLSLQNLAVTDTGLEALARLPNLHTMWLQNVDVQGTNWAGLSGLTTLIWTTSPNARLTAAAMQGVGDLRALTLLELEVPVPDDGVQHLASLSALERASLTGPLSADGLRHLGSLPRLRKLTLCDVDVTSDGFSGLAVSSSLQELSLTRCRCDTGTLLALEQLKTLESLGLNRSEAISDDVQSLIARRPDLHVYVDKNVALRTR